MEDLKGGYSPNNLVRIDDNRFKDPEGRIYKRSDCSSEVCAQGSGGCSCEGTGYRYRQISGDDKHYDFNSGDGLKGEEFRKWFLAKGW